MLERLECVTRNVGLKYTLTPQGTTVFISSDMFHLEIAMETSGTVKDAKISHGGEAVVSFLVAFLPDFKRSDLPLLQK